VKIVALSLPFPGVSRVLEEGEKLGFFEFVKIQGDRVAIPPADVYLLGAWHPTYNNLLTALDGKIGVLWCSSAGEVDFEPVERKYLAEIINNKKIDFVWFGDKALGEVWGKGFYAPYGMKLLDQYQDQEKKDIVTLFCPPTVKKNLLNQIIAIALLQRKQDLVLHTNIPIDSGFAASIKLEYIHHNWLQDKEYRDLIASSKLNFAVSWAETLNYQSAEAMFLGTLSVMSAAIPWATPHLTVKNSNNALEIAGRALHILDCSQRTGYTVDEFRRSLVRYFVDANEHLREALNAL